MTHLSNLFRINVSKKLHILGYVFVKAMQVKSLDLPANNVLPVKERFQESEM